MTIPSHYVCIYYTSDAVSSPSALRWQNPKMVQLSGQACKAQILDHTLISLQRGASLSKLWFCALASELS